MKAISSLAGATKIKGDNEKKKKKKKKKGLNKRI